jgi:hypothetical protein
MRIWAKTYYPGMKIITVMELFIVGFTIRFRQKPGSLSTRQICMMLRGTRNIHKSNICWWLSRMGTRLFRQMTRVVSVASIYKMYFPTLSNSRQSVSLWTFRVLLRLCAKLAPQIPSSKKNPDGSPHQVTGIYPLRVPFPL